MQKLFILADEAILTVLSGYKTVSQLRVRFSCVSVSKLPFFACTMADTNRHVHYIGSVDDILQTVQVSHIHIQILATTLVCFGRKTYFSPHMLSKLV